MSIVYGYWDRYEPRPPEHEINLDLLDFSKWVAEISPDLDPSIVEKLARAGNNPSKFTWPEGSILRTPEDRFENMPDFPYPPKYLEIEGLRMAYVEHGDGDPILCLHGEPTWGFLYRKMIPILSQMGRVIVPDHIGFGRSDKPVLRQAYTYKSFVRWMRTFIRKLDLERITLICQDWGGLIGIRVLADAPERFCRLAAMNTGLPTGETPSESFLAWRRLSQILKELDVPGIIQSQLRRDLKEGETKAFGAPFPSREYQTAALIFHRLVPIRPDHPGTYENRMAAEKLKALDIPVILPWAENDAITRDWEPQLRAWFKNTAPRRIIKGAGHFIQEDAGEETAALICEWMGKT